MPTNNAFCSICTINYLAYATTLNKSLIESGHNEPHYVLLVDYDKKYKKLVSNTNLIPIPISKLKVPGINKLIQKYNAFELSNILKPYFIKWLLEYKPNIQILIYLDTDVYVYSKFTDIFKYFKNNENTSVLLTNHILFPDKFDEDNSYTDEQKFFYHGLYNGGFYGVRNDHNSKQFLDWHYKKISIYGYNAAEKHVFVDQKILDFAPILFEYVKIFKNNRYNVAHWNYFEGLIKQSSGNYFINGKPLVFFHFSQITQKVDGLYNGHLKVYPNTILEKLTLEYLNHLNTNKNKDIAMIPYGYIDRYIPPHESYLKPNTYNAQQVNQLTQKNIQLQMQNSQYENRLREIIESTGWKLLANLYSFRDLILPENSVLKKFLKHILIYFKSLKRYPKINIQRRINTKSKKIVLVDHSYHLKTKSSNFLISYLEKHFEITYISDYSWKGDSFPNIDFIDKSYLGVIFWQSLPPASIINSINNDNLIFFPMYDGNGNSPKQFWDQYPSLKIINFTKALHQKLSKWGFDSMYIQYFPKPQKFLKQRLHKVFFWQRIESININLVEKLIGSLNTKLHFHNSPDPNHALTRPTNRQESKFDITYSSWFKTQKDVRSKIQECDIYIAPRELEGIGLSFLEAMAMGKAVIAVNNPSMNEYISDSKTGYLYDIHHVKPINFQNLEKVRFNTYNYIKTGYNQWQKQKHLIIKYIKKP